jgi:hypothetical protein
MLFNGDTVLQPHHNSLGRVCFMLGTLVLLHSGRRVLSGDGAVSRALAARPGRCIPLARLARFAWNLVFIGIFLLALFGFYITAYFVVFNLIRTAEFSIVLALTSALIRQGGVTRRRRSPPPVPCTWTRKRAVRTCRSAG